jgi:dienelactone hydrolase
VAVASLNLPGVVAAVNFAGGGGGNPKTRPMEPCRPQFLERMFRDFGRSAKVPMLWIYAENDLYFGARYPREWFEAYKAGGAPAEMKQFPPRGENGHLLFSRFAAEWQPVVDAFLARQGFELKPRP